MSRETGRRFHFIREIASGGFGAVYLTKVMHADGFSRLAAVKLLHRRWSENEEIARRMRDEARLLGWLRHRNIVDVVDLTSIDGRAAVVMEYLEAVDLKFIIAELAMRGELVPPKVVLDIMSAVASALDAAYNRPPYPGEKPLRVIHRDIKPSNVMVDESGLVKVLDFGVARADFDARESHTRELQFGSVDYMPPERLFFEPETPASDVYSLGAAMYEMLALEKLGKAKGRPERHARFLVDRFSFMRATIGIPGSAASELERLLASCLAFDHNDRPSAEDASRIARTLSRTLDGPGLREWSESEVPGLLRRADQMPRNPNPLTDSVLMEDSKAFEISQALPTPTGTDTSPAETALEEPVPSKPPWMFEETQEEPKGGLEEVKLEPPPLQASPTIIPDLDDLDDLMDAEPVPFGHTEAEITFEEDPETEESQDLPAGIQNPFVDAPPPQTTSPFTDDVDPDLLATRVAPDPAALLDELDQATVVSDAPPQDPPTVEAEPAGEAPPSFEPPPPPAFEPPPPPAFEPPPPPAFEAPEPFEEPETRVIERALGEAAPTEIADGPVPPAFVSPVGPVARSPLPSLAPSLDDWDDVPTRIEAPPTAPEPNRPAGALQGFTPPPPPSDAPPPVEAAPPPPPPTLAPPTLAPPGIQGVETRITPVAVQEEPTLPPPAAEQPPSLPPADTPTEIEAPKSRMPMVMGLLFGLAFVCAGVCGGGFALQRGLIPLPEGVAIPGLEVAVEVPEEVPTPDEPPPEEAPVEVATGPAGPHMSFVSLAEGTRKLKVQCSDSKGQADGSTAYVESVSEAKCTVTAYMEDRSRLTAIVTDASEGEYRCFEGGEARCDP